MPGGRVLSPYGAEHVTGPGAFGIAISPSGKTVVTANIGPWRPGLTVAEHTRQRWEIRQIPARSQDPLDTLGPSDWRSASTGVVFSSEHTFYVAEGNTGRIALFDSNDDRRRTIIELNQGTYRDSYSGELAFDNSHNILYAVDQANARISVIDGKTRQIVTSVAVGRLPFALALSPDHQKLYVTTIGLFDYRSIGGADPSDPRASGLAFPALGYPSAEALAGVERPTARGISKAPGVGAPEPQSLLVVDVSTPVEAHVAARIPLGGGPSAIAATADRVYVSLAARDAIAVIDAANNRLLEEIPLRIPGLESLRGVIPNGLAFHEKSGWLLVAESGINAIAVIDVAARRVLGHLPTGLYPTRVALDRDMVFVTTAKGHGDGPNVPGDPYWPTLRMLGSLAIFPLPDASDLAASTAFVFEANGFTPRPTRPASRFPGAIRHVVLIVKESRSYDDVLGDLIDASNGSPMGAPELAHLGENGFVDGRHLRMSLREANLTPNQHAIARQWAFSDNFYADGDGSLDGHHWLAGAYPQPWTESSILAALAGLKDFRLGTPGRMAFAGTASSVQPEDEPEAGSLWQHLAAHGVSFRSFGEGIEMAGVSQGPDFPPLGARFLTNMPMPAALYAATSREYPGFNIHISDQARATQFIRELNTAGDNLPQFLYVYLPGDYGAPARPDEGYPYEESFVSDNDYALGRILEALSHSKAWNSMAVFVTEAAAHAGTDHIDAHRTLLFCAGPWAKRNYVSHTNASFPALLKTIFGLLHLPPLNLFDATAADLADCFASQPDPAPYRVRDVDKRVFDPTAELSR